MAKKQSDGISTAQKFEIGIGLTTAAVAAAGAYFLYGSKNAAKNRKTVKSWMLKAKAEVLEQLEEAKEMTWEEYEALIEQITAAYATAKTATKKDLKEFQEEMKAHWGKIAKEAPKKAKKGATIAKKTTKKAAKSATKTAAKKTKKIAKKVEKKASE